MIEKEKKLLIHGRVKNLLPEYKKMLDALDGLKMYFKTCCYSVLNNSEKEILEKYPEIIIPQPSIDINGNEIIKIERNNGNIDLSDLIYKIKPEVYDNNYFCNEPKISEWRYYTTITFDDYQNKSSDIKQKDIKIVPILFKNWADLKEKYPDYYIEARDMLIDAMKLRYKLLEKLTILDNVLDKMNINITMIKKFYPELYKLSIK